jgi:hypothetical protein
MQYLSPVYTVTKPVHVSGLLVAHHQQVKMYICKIGMCFTFRLTVSCKYALFIYALLSLTDDGQLASPKHVKV